MPPRESEQDRGTEAIHHPTKRGTQRDQLPRWCRSAPDAVSQSGTEAHKEMRRAEPERVSQPAPPPTTSRAGRTAAPAIRNATRARATCIAGAKKGNEKGKADQRQAHKPTKRGYPPPIAMGRQPFPSSQIRAKKSAKSRLGVVLKKFSEKFFVGMFRGKEKPLALSQREGDCLINLTNHGNCK